MHATEPDTDAETRYEVVAGGRRLATLQPDILNPGEHYYVVHLDEDYRGPVRVHERSRIRDVAQYLVDTHPLG